MEASARRQKCFEALRALSLRGARLRPLVLVFEDLHWIDAGTEEYLASMTDAVASVPLMVILTYRVGYAPPVPARSFHTTLTLHALSEADAVAMAGHVLGADDLPPALRQALLDKAEGVPLFIEEVTKTLLDLGVLRRDGGVYRIVEGVGPLNVPDTIQGIIMARLDRLGEDGKRTVQLASVIGRQFLGRLLERVAGVRERLTELLEELKELEIIYELGLAPEPSYIFKHALIQDVAYQSLLKERRRELHRAVGRAIEEIYADRLAEHAEELAHHFENGDDWQKAFTYLVRSGDRAKAAYANQAALDFYARALEVGARVTPPLAPTRIVEVHHRRGEALRLLARYADSIAAFELMRDVARSSGDRVREGEALVEISYSQFLTFNNAGIDRCRRFAEEALAIGRETGDQHVVARSLCYLGLASQADGDPARGRPAVRGVARHRPGRRLRGHGGGEPHLARGPRQLARRVRPGHRYEPGGRGGRARDQRRPLRHDRGRVPVPEPDRPRPLRGGARHHRRWAGQGARPQQLVHHGPAHQHPGLALPGGGRLPPRDRVQPRGGRDRPGGQERQRRGQLADQPEPRRAQPGRSPARAGPHGGDPGAGGEVRLRRSPLAMVAPPERVPQRGPDRERRSRARPRACRQGAPAGPQHRIDEVRGARPSPSAVRSSSTAAGGTTPARAWPRRWRSPGASAIPPSRGRPPISSLGPRRRRGGWTRRRPRPG